MIGSRLARSTAITSAGNVDTSGRSTCVLRVRPLMHQLQKRSLSGYRSVSLSWILAVAETQDLKTGGFQEAS